MKMMRYEILPGCLCGYLEVGELFQDGSRTFPQRLISGRPSSQDIEHVRHNSAVSA